MMGIALQQDTQNPDQGVFIDRVSDHANGTTTLDRFMSAELESKETLSRLSDRTFIGTNGKITSSHGKTNISKNDKHYWNYASPFLGRIISYMQQLRCPFEHVDAWVPSYVPDSAAIEGSGTSNSNSTSCRLCFAGSATAEIQIPPDGVSPSIPMAQQELFNLMSFGDYSQKFSFNVGCGLPGRVYESGIPAWEQSVHNAPHCHFERCGGAIQWCIKTVVGIPVPSPSVGRIVVVAYSMHDRNKDQGLVGKLYEEFKKVRSL